MNPNSSQRNGQQVSSGETFYGDEILQYTTTVVLDDLVDADITLLKLDVEGTEFLALMGLNASSANESFVIFTLNFHHQTWNPCRESILPLNS